jgi:hypothetical protein
MTENLIYYISEDAIDQLYRKKFGSLATEKTKTTENLGGLTAKLGLNKLVSLISFSGDANLGHKHSEQVKVNESAEDRANILLKTLFSKSSLKDIDEINASHFDPLYRFSLPLNIEEKFGSNSGETTYIEIKHISEKLEITGTSSPNNWLSGSLLNSFLYNNIDTHINASGIVSPLSAKQEGSKLRALVQFILVCQGDIWEP